jgi:versiconal hemiacetal acetate esterase
VAKRQQHLFPRSWFNELTYTQLENSLGSRPAFHGTVEDIRLQFVAVGQIIGPLLPSPDPSLIVKDETLNSGLDVRVYTSTKLLTPAKQLPLGVYYHGGRFIMGNLDAEDADCRYIAQHTPCIIVAVDYRHAPEYALNDILDDALEGYEWVSFKVKLSNPKSGR